MSRTIGVNGWGRLRRVLALAAVVSLLAIGCSSAGSVDESSAADPEVGTPQPVGEPEATRVPEPDPTAVEPTPEVDPTPVAEPTEAIAPEQAVQEIVNELLDLPEGPEPSSFSLDGATCAATGIVERIGVEEYAKRGGTELLAADALSPEVAEAYIACDLTVTMVLILFDVETDEAFPTEIEVECFAEYVDKDWAAELLRIRADKGDSGEASLIVGAGLAEGIFLC